MKMSDQQTEDAGIDRLRSMMDGKIHQGCVRSLSIAGVAGMPFGAGLATEGIVFTALGAASMLVLGWLAFALHPDAETLSAHWEEYEEVWS